MKMTPKKDVRDLTPGEAATFHDALVNVLIDEEAERIAALGPEELNRELLAKGFDPAAERAKAQAFIAELRAMGLDPVVERAKGRALVEKLRSSGRTTR